MSSAVCVTSLWGRVQSRARAQKKKNKKDLDARVHPPPSPTLWGRLAAPPPLFLPPPLFFKIFFSPFFGGHSGPSPTIFQFIPRLSSRN